MGLIIFPIYIYLTYSMTNSNVSILCIIVILVELNENRTGRHVIFLMLINKILGLIISRPVYQKHLKLGLYFLLNDNVFNSRLCAKVSYYFSLRFYFEFLFLVKILKLDN